MITSDATPRPPLINVHHLALTVTDIDASTEWYQRILGLQPIPVRIPHHGNEESGYGRLLTDPTTGISVGLHHHCANDRLAASENRTGLDHFAISVPSRTDLVTWAAWLDAHGVDNSGVIDATDPFTYAVVVFRDPDNIQLELVYLQA